LSVYPNGTLTVAETGTIKHTDDGEVNVRVVPLTSSWTAKKATVTGDQTNGWEVTLTDATGAALNITLGTVNITSSDDIAVSVNLQDAEPDAAGSLTAGSNTQILFLGVAAE
jgi:hypothetical protein